MRTIVSVLVLMVAAAAQAQQPQGPGAGPAPGRIGGAGIGAYPQRTSDPAAVERGRAVYGTYCAFCHGADTRGGDGGPSLLRSAVVLDDRNGELIGPIVLAGRVDRGMPMFPLTADQIGDVAAFMHSFRVNGYDAARNQPQSIVVGDAAAGEAYVKATCASCHTPDDLKAFASAVDNARTMQQRWLMPGTAAGRGAPLPANSRPPRVVVTLPSGETIDGEIERLDDFTVALRLDDGSRRAWRRSAGVPRVEVRDPLKPHRDLLRTYTDADIHNVTAYLMTLK